MSQESLIFLSRPAVLACLDKLDPVEVAADVLRVQAAGRTEIPAEGYLPWTNSDGAYSRAIAMLGALHREEGPVYGMKLINAAVNNPSKGIERAGGLSFVFDPETARPKLIAEAGYLSAVRTAAYTMVSLRALGRSGGTASRSSARGPWPVRTWTCWWAPSPTCARWSSSTCPSTARRSWSPGRTGSTRS